MAICSSPASDLLVQEGCSPLVLPPWSLTSHVVLNRAAPWTLVHGDAIDVLRQIPAGFADALITDEPYSSGGMMRSDRLAPVAVKYSPTRAYPTFSGDNRDARSWLFWCLLWLSECARIVRPGGYVLLFSDWRQLPLVTDLFQAANGLLLRGIIPWDKGPTARAPHTGYARHQCEYIIWGSVGSLAPADGRGPFPGCYHIPLPPAEKEHLTAKPVALMRALARMVPPDGLILDPFAGSASTGIGALLERRRFLGVELGGDFIAPAQRRLAAAMQARLLLERRAAATVDLEREEVALPQPLPPGDPRRGLVVGWPWRGGAR
ncbi:MAG TPA: DNA methyltransferase [Roseiflexaceae bacterium]|nr:DNA methyltransferase [Roseiflexaceae bacterium]